MKLRRITAHEFVRRLKAYVDADGSDAKFAFFIGAGCSVSSGIPAARELVRERWLPQLRDVAAPHRADIESWATEEFGIEKGSSLTALYGEVIQRLFHAPAFRQAEVEALCAGKQPSFGYAMLATLMAQPESPFNCVLTTNFDDLVADALYLFTGARPLVIHHASLAPFIRPARRRPMIVKLHGDHHLAALNTQEETAALDEQLGAPVRSLLFDRGLVFVGYGGRDKGILELLESLPDDALRYGVYWVNGTQPDGDVASWLAKREALWVDHHDFDELMVLFKDVFALPDPDRSQIDDTFDSIQRAYIALSSQIRESSSSDPDASALRAAVARLDASLSDWGAVEIKAQQFKRHDPDKAASIYEEGIARLPHSVPLIGNYANLLKDQGKLDIADEMYRRALAIDPNHAPVLADYGVFLWRCRNAPNLAEEYLQRARTADPSLAHNLANLASFLYQERGAFEQAAQLFRDAQSINSDDPDILGLYAQFLVNARNDYMRGLMFYQRALDLNPAHLGNLINYAALVPQVTEDLDIAVVAYGRALALDENNPTLLVNYADFLWHNVHDADRAEAAYRKALQAAPEDQHINGAFASFLWEARGDVETARRLFTEASTSGSLGRYFALNYAKFLDKVDHDLEGAEQQYMKAVDRFPEDAVVLGNAGAFLEQALNDKERAAELYRRAIYADPHNIIAQTNLAGLLLERGQQDEGLSLLGSTFRLIGHSATAAAVEAWFYLFVYGDVERRQSALEGLYRALARGARSEEWNLDRHVVIGTAMNHPDAEYLPMLASVIAGREDLSILRNWKAWQDLEESVAP